MPRAERTKYTIGYTAKGEDHEALYALSRLLERNVSDTLRFVVREAARARGILPPVGVDQSQAAGSQAPQQTAG